MAFGTSPGCVLRERVMGAMTMRCGALRPAKEMGEKRVFCMALLLFLPTSYALLNWVDIHRELDTFSTFGKESPGHSSRAFGRGGSAARKASRSLSCVSGRNRKASFLKKRSKKLFSPCCR